MKQRKIYDKIRDIFYVFTCFRKLIFDIVFQKLSSLDQNISFLEKLIWNLFLLIIPQITSALIHKIQI